MDGAHDLGGKTGFGKVVREPNEPVFHHLWEGLAWALFILSVAKLRAYKADAYRHAVERMEPGWYLRARYYERMLTGVTTLLIERGVVPHEELESVSRLVERGICARGVKNRAERARLNADLSRDWEASRRKALAATRYALDSASFLGQSHLELNIVVRNFRAQLATLALVQTNQAVALHRLECAR